MATRSSQKEIREGNGKHCACEQPPDNTALENYQNSKKRCYGIKKITSGGDQESAALSVHCTSAPHRRAATAIQRKYSAHYITTHSSDADNKEQNPKCPNGFQNLLRSKTRMKI